MPTYSTPKPISLITDLAVGDVTLIASDRRDTVVTVEAAAAGNNLSVQAAQAIEVQHVGDQLVVKQSMPWYQSYNGSVPTSLVTVTIELPRQSTVRGRTALGAYVSEGVLGSVELDVSNGDVRLDTVTRDLAVKGSNGHVVVESVGGDVEVKTSNGNIRIGEVASGTVRLTTALGGIEVGVRQGVAALLDAKTQLGSVKNSLSSADGPAAFSGSVKIRARTHVSDIVIRHADEPAGVTTA